MEPFMANNRRDEDKWKLKKEISIGDILAFLAAFSGILFAYTTLDKRLALSERAQTAQEVIDKRQDEEALRYQVRLDAMITNINVKLDRIIEGRRQH